MSNIVLKIILNRKPNGKSLQSAERKKRGKTEYPPPNILQWSMYFALGRSEWRAGKNSGFDVDYGGQLEEKQGALSSNTARSGYCSSIYQGLTASSISKSLALHSLFIDGHHSDMCWAWRSTSPHERLETKVTQVLSTRNLAVYRERQVLRPLASPEPPPSAAIGRPTRLQASLRLYFLKDLF